LRFDSDCLLGPAYEGPNIDQIFVENPSDARRKEPYRVKGPSQAILGLEIALYRTQEASVGVYRPAGAFCIEHLGREQFWPASRHSTGGLQEDHQELEEFMVFGVVGLEFVRIPRIGGQIGEFPLDLL